MALSNDTDVEFKPLCRKFVRQLFLSVIHISLRIQEPREDFNLWHDMHIYDSSNDGNDSSYILSNNFDQSRNSVNSRASFVTIMKLMPSQKDESSKNFKEMFLAVTVIHIVPKKKIVDIPLYKRWATPDAYYGYEALVANQEAFKDMIVSPSMFIDHLPWRCSHALKRILEKRKLQHQLDGVGLRP
ncbi:hypothetical protein Tco_1506241 [Tanacetum coccineum]